jgi:hypothetical protein
MQKSSKWWTSLPVIEEHETRKNERVEVYYERLLKLANNLQYKTTNNFLTTISNMDYNHIYV